MGSVYQKRPRRVRGRCRAEVSYADRSPRRRHDRRQIAGTPAMPTRALTRARRHDPDGARTPSLASARTVSIHRGGRHQPGNGTSLSRSKRLLGEGGFGQVYLARRLDRSVAVPNQVCIKVSAQHRRLAPRGVFRSAARRPSAGDPRLRHSSRCSGCTRRPARSSTA